MNGEFELSEWSCIVTPINPQIKPLLTKSEDAEKEQETKFLKLIFYTISLI